MKNKDIHPIISIFMPVYNGEKYLRKSIESVLNQTFKDFELVCVDDTSTDNSFSILDEYSKIDDRIIIYQKKQGGNVPKSWNFVMPKLRGEFITYMSQDDLMSPDNLSENYNRYLETGADIIVPDMIFYNEGKINKDGIYGLKDKIISGEEAFFLSFSWKNIHGFPLYKADIIKNEIFDEKIYNSDEYVSRKCFLLSNKVAFSKGIFYYGQDNENAITKKITLNSFTTLYTDKMIDELAQMHFGADSIQSIEMQQLRMSRIMTQQVFYFRHKQQFSEIERKEIVKIIKENYRNIKKEHLYSDNKIKKILYTNGYQLYAFSCHVSTMKQKIGNYIKH